MAEITVSSVKKSYGKTEVIRGLDLVVGDGEFVVILGPSGCGKSTLLRMIAGLEVITEGHIAIGGLVVNDLEPRERGCAMVFQNYALYPHMSVADNIGYALKVQGMKKKERLEKVRQTAEHIGLAEFLDRKPSELSGGQRQRVAMGRAIVREPSVFLFDEPLSNLDATLRVQIRLEIRDLHQRLSATSVFVTHDQIEAMTLADRLVVMNNGRIEQVGTPHSVYNAPATTYVARFLGAPPMNILRGTVAHNGRSIVLDGGQTLTIDPEVSRDAAGLAVDVGVRPERAVMARESKANALRLTHRFAEELGGARLFHADCDGSPFIIHTGETVTPEPGATLDVEISPQDINLFDRERGQRLGVVGEHTRLAAE